MSRSYDLVLDCSIVMAWCFEDEETSFSMSILERLRKERAVVPTIWHLEVANVLLSAMKSKRITEIKYAEFIDSLSALPIFVDESTTARATSSVFLIASKANLSIYDACYLELALREKIPLITLDKKLITAAEKLNVSLR